MPVWSCSAVPSRTAPESTEPRAVCSPASAAVVAAKGTRRRSSISGTPGRGTTTRRRPPGRVDSTAAGTGCGRGSPSGGGKGKGKAPGPPPPRPAGGGAGIQVAGGGLHLVGGHGGEAGGELAGELRAAVHQLRGSEPERAAQHRVGLAEQLRLRARLHPLQLVGGDAVLGDPMDLLVHRRLHLLRRDGGRVVHLGGEQGGVADVERVAEQADVAALRDRDAVVVDEPTLEAGGVAPPEQL